MRRKLIAFCLLFAPFAACTRALHAQLRPVDPSMWNAFDGDANLFVTGGVGFLNGQTLSLAGTRGRLNELGIYSITWRTGRVAVTGSGTAVWRMSDERTVGTALPGVGATHEDAGPVIIETAVRLTPEKSPLLWLLRFGTRLPTTSRVSGLERDESDFFTTLGLRSRGRLWAAAEAGVAINGKPVPRPGQTDVLVYVAGAGYRTSTLPVSAELWLVGHDDLHGGDARGNENLQELRAGIRTNGSLWMRAQWIHGFADYSPSDGVRLTLGYDARLNRMPLLGWQ